MVAADQRTCHRRRLHPRRGLRSPHHDGATAASAFPSSPSACRFRHCRSRSWRARRRRRAARSRIHRRTVQIDEAKALGLIDEKCPAGMLLDRATRSRTGWPPFPPARSHSRKRRSTADPRAHQQLADYNARVSSVDAAAHLRHDSRILEKTIKKNHNPRAEIRIFPIPVANPKSKLASIADPSRSAATNDRSVSRIR